MRPPDIAVIMSAQRCALTPTPGVFFGQEVAIFHCNGAWARTTAGAASVPARAPAPAPSMVRRLIDPNLRVIIPSIRQPSVRRPADPSSARRDDNRGGAAQA